MKPNLFLFSPQNPFAAKVDISTSADGQPPACLSAHAEERPSNDCKTDQRFRRLVKGACMSFAGFAITGFMVFREIQHTHELQRMSRLVTMSEVEMRHWQEKQRLEEGRVANLAAVLHSQQSLARNSPGVKSTYFVRLPGIGQRGAARYETTLQ